MDCGQNAVEDSSTYRELGELEGDPKSVPHDAAGTDLDEPRFQRCQQLKGNLVG